MHLREYWKILSNKYFMLVMRISAGGIITAVCTVETKSFWTLFFAYVMSVVVLPLYGLQGPRICQLQQSFRSNNLVCLLLPIVRGSYHTCSSWQMTWVMQISKITQEADQNAACCLFLTMCNPYKQIRKHWMCWPGSFPSKKEEMSSGGPGHCHP